MRSLRVLATAQRPWLKRSIAHRPTHPFKPWLLTLNGAGGTRHLHLAPFVMPPLIFSGLFLALWCWKCAMLVLFQNTIIYNPFLPPNARSMRIADFARECGGLEWREERIQSLDGTNIALCVTEVPPRSQPSATVTPVYILYFQGNASSLPPRLPDISRILQRLQDTDEAFHYTVVCLSYRGFWTSHDRPSEPGINQDSQAALQWIAQLHRARRDGARGVAPVVVLWGQSIGCGFATNLAAVEEVHRPVKVDALVLETPFTSTRAMLRALYPQKWLPYQYLWPFLRNHLDSWKNLGVIAQRAEGRTTRIYIVEAGKDELVPADHGAILYQRCRDVGLPVERYTILGALHNEAMVRPAGKRLIAQAISSAVASVASVRAAHQPRATQKKRG
ncbi:hypothetical protein S40285_04350 [Stachybotrys chlorohalonatus IBT 40285]|uniref:AB hydrolase-1 domain-containing protein n=1 Tax=Stachybotrys chlorohalonatus (strain IBT 40285) TaxID=1283841 RepID=A0A084QNQ7_STAC4|nr:hypothetical protein S40285_04350 [Stachybotrys chlorohalonata IBT 40285]